MDMTVTTFQCPGELFGFVTFKSCYKKAPQDDGFVEMEDGSKQASWDSEVNIEHAKQHMMSLLGI